MQTPESQDVTAPEEATRARDATSTAALVGAVVAWLQRASNGDRATLRRSDDGLDVTFWKLDADVLHEALDRASDRRDAERRWSVIVRALAALTPGEGASLYDRSRRVGDALVATGVSDARFLKVARAHGEALHRELRAVVQHVVAKRERIDFTPLAELVLADGTDRDDAARRSLARSYYAALHRATDND